VVLIDTDVLLIQFRYLRDFRFQENSVFLSQVQGKGPCITIYNLMEFLGQMSFNMSSGRLSLWDKWLRGPLGLFVMWPEGEEQGADTFFFDEVYGRPFSKMLESGNGMAFNDALIIGLGERTSGIDAFVTWNVRHFRAKTILNVLTPQEYVQSL
jgi:hypothetical protein